MHLQAQANKRAGRMNDFYALIKVQQGRLRSAMKEMGVPIAELA